MPLVILVTPVRTNIAVTANMSIIAHDNTNIINSTNRTNIIDKPRCVVRGLAGPSPGPPPVPPPPPPPREEAQSLVRAGPRPRASGGPHRGPFPLTFRSQYRIPSLSKLT